MKIAMIGAGGIARRHLEVLSKETDVEIVAHLATQQASLDHATRQWGGRGYLDIETLLKNEFIDAAWIAVPPGAHGEIEYALIERGIPFFVEKPLSADRETAEAIGQRIAEKSLVVGVGYQWRAMDTVWLVKQKLAHQPARMVLGRWHDATPPPQWWRQQATSGGQMVEQATHLIDIARYLLGEAVVTYAKAAGYDHPQHHDADVATVSAAMLEFPNHVPGVFTATCLLNNANAVDLQIICDGLYITIERQRVLFDSGGEKHEVKLQQDPFRRENRAFIEAVAHHDPSRLFSSYADALETHRLCHTIQAVSGVARSS
jgi:predicted dehydrogenase